MTTEQTPAALAATDAIAARLAELRDEMRATVGRIQEPQGKAILETGAEVLGGLRQAFVDYAAGSEEAWQRCLLPASSARSD